MLLPTLSKAKGKAQSIACVNNLRQLQLCWNLYLDENEDKMPPTSTKAGGAGIAISVEPSWAAPPQSAAFDIL